MSRLSFFIPDSNKLPNHSEPAPFLDITSEGKTLYTLGRQSPYLFEQGREGHFEDPEPNDRLKFWPNWDSLNEFIKAWDSRILVFENPLRRPQFSVPSDAQSNCGISLHLVPNKTAGSVDIATPRLSIDADKQQATLTLQAISFTPTSFVDPKKRKCEASLTLGEVVGFPMDFRASMATAAGAKWSPTPFNEAFADLDSSTKYSRSINLPDLVAYLREESDKEGEKVEMFGAKIPFELVSSFGSLLLACCQFYLFCHLAEFKKKFQSAPEGQELTGYIGLYDIKLARIFTLITVSLLPALTQAFTLWKTGFGRFAWLTPTIGLISSSLLGVALVVMYRQLWAVMDVTPQAAK